MLWLPSPVIWSIYVGGTKNRGEAHAVTALTLIQQGGGRKDRCVAMATAFGAQRPHAIQKPLRLCTWLSFSSNLQPIVEVPEMFFFLPMNTMRPQLIYSAARAKK